VPTWLLDQASKYKQQLWEMKNGVLNSSQLQKLPLALQMELIFDINVGEFHNTLLFKSSGDFPRVNVALLEDFVIIMKI
jgi:hypothetical protein